MTRAKIQQVTHKDVQAQLDKLGEQLTLVDPKIKDWSQRYISGHIAHYSSLLTNIRLIQQNSPVQSVLDIGAIPGQITAILKQQGLDIEAVDLQPQRAQQLFETMNIPYYQVNVERDPLPFDTNSIDLVIFSEILEHLRHNPIYPLKEIYRVLKPGGNFLISTPNITPLMRWRFLCGQNIQGDLIHEFTTLANIGHMGHFRLYTRSELQHYLTAIGFHILTINRGGKLQPGGGMLGTFLRRIIRDRMHVQIYIWATKQPS